MFKGNKQQKASVSKIFLLARFMFVVGRFCRVDVAGVICLFLLFFCFQSLFNADINTTFRVIFIEFLLATVVRSLWFFVY